MRRKTIFLFFATLLSAESNAQEFWNGSATPTNTKFNVGIGMAAYPTDASLSIINYASAPPPVPAISVLRYMETATTAPNFFQLTQAIAPGSTVTTLDVFDHQGWLGILTPHPHAPLDVAGDAFLEKDLTVGNNATIDANLQVNHAATVNQNLNVGNNATVNQNLVVGNNASVNQALYILPGATLPGTPAKLSIADNFYTDYTYGGGPVPEMKIQRNIGGELVFGEVIPNFLEIWTEHDPHISIAYVTDPTDYLIDVINAAGYLGIKQAHPTQSLDVGKNALIEDSLIVDGPIIANGPLISTGGLTATNLNVLNTLRVGDIAVIGYNAYPFTLPAGYSLYVSKGILTEQVRVALHGSTEWADYVFKKDYKLMPLQKVEDYINKNNHLPDVPAAADVKKDGIDVASMDANLLKKIEELTLYAIEQQKQIDKLQEELNTVLKEKK